MLSNMAKTRKRTRISTVNTRRLTTAEPRTRGPDYRDPQNKPPSLAQKNRMQRMRGRVAYGPTEEMIASARLLAKGGATNFEIQRALAIPDGTFWMWSATNDAFRDAIMAKDAMDDRIERTLAERATGYKYESEKIFSHQGRIIRAKTIEHVPPDVSAIALWLKNRRPQQWRDDKTVHLNGKIDVNDSTSERELALAMLALLREAENEDQPLTIEHKDAAE